MTTITQPRAGLYICSRTSSWRGKPCDSAFEINAHRVDTRGVDDPAKLAQCAASVGGWYAEGTNHRVVDGRIFRDLVTKEWAVQIPDITDFVKEHGRCVVSVNNAGYSEIEIYDNYRE